MWNIFSYSCSNAHTHTHMLSFWIAMTICNSLYFYTHECYRTNYMNYKRCNSLYIRSHFNATHCNLVATRRNNSFSITMQLPYDYNHNITLTSFFIHSSKFNMWHYEKKLVIFLKYWYPLSTMIINFRWHYPTTCGTIKSCHMA